MNEKLKITIQWTLFVIFLIFIIIFLILPIVFSIFFSEEEFTIKLLDAVALLSPIASATSLGLGVFSIYQAKLGNDQVNQILTNVRCVLSSQETIVSLMSKTTLVETNKKDDSKNSKWDVDKIKD